MTNPANSPSPAWHPIHEIHGARGRALVCAEVAAVVRDDRNVTPYEINGDVVGYVTSISDEGFQLEGHTFATWVKWEHARAAWPRAEAPDPCPVCGEDGV
jgi:hypothetical protein